MYKQVLIAVAMVAMNGATAPGQLLVSQSLYGINTHIPSDGMVAKLQSGNIAWARIDLNWLHMEPSKGNFNWGPIDAVVNSANQRGIHLYAGLGYTPGWANGGQGGTVPPTDPNDWKDFVRAVVNRYKDSIRHYGMWNEPDLDQFFSGTTSQYINIILVPGAEAIREADPTALRCAPDLAGDSDFLEDVLNAAKDYVDVVTVHKYDEQVSEIMKKFDGWHLPWQDKNYKEVLEDTGAWGKAVWFTEVGWPTADGTHVDEVTEQEQADLYVELLDEVRQRPWINKIFFYELKDDPTAGIPKWGILYDSLGEKLAYGAYRDYVSAHPPSEAVTVCDLRRYSLVAFSVGSQYFSDRSFTITSMPAYLAGCTGIQTKNDDKDETSEAWIDFDLDREADVYVAYDRRATSLPNWMADYTEMGDVINVSDSGQGYARLYRRTFPVREVVLGANMAAGAAGAGSNYFVLILPGGTGPPEKAADPNPPHLATGVRTNAHLTWTAAAGATSYDVYFGTSQPPSFQDNVPGTAFDPGIMSPQTDHFWRIDAVNDVGATPSEVWSFTTGSGPGDFDGDTDVDQEDFGHFQTCLTGSGNPAGTGCQDADLDSDTDVDLSDFSIFQACLSGPNVPADPGCAD